MPEEKAPIFPNPFPGDEVVVLYRHTPDRDIHPDTTPRACFGCVCAHDVLRASSPCRDCTKPRYPRVDSYRKGT